MLALGLEAYEYHRSSAILKFHGPTVCGLVCSELERQFQLWQLICWVTKPDPDSEVYPYKTTGYRV